MKRVLFIHGGGGGAFEADEKLASSLRSALGKGYEVHYPRMPDEDEPDYDTWKKIIVEFIGKPGGDAILVGHSIGASVLIKVLSDLRSVESIAGLFLISAPFWHDHDFWHWKEATLPDDVSKRVPAELPLFLYHGEADESVPVDHVQMYAKVLPRAVVRRLPGRDHQLGEDLTEVARDIDGLS